MKDSTKYNIGAAIILILLLGGVYYIDEHVACNKKGSFAAKINWAGHKECLE
jgi:hypothetical protein